MRLKQRTTLAEKKVTGKLEDIPHPTLDATIYELFKPERQLAHKAKDMVQEHRKN